MRTERANNLKTYLEEVATRLGGKLNIRADEGERDSSVSITFDTNVRPPMWVDADQHGLLSFRTQLPTDRWGFSQRSSAHQGSASCNVNPFKNSAKRCAQYVEKMLVDHNPAWRAHLDVVTKIEQAYDEQMATARRIAQRLTAFSPTVENLDQSPNHIGVTTVHIHTQGRYPSVRVKYGGNIEISMGGVGVDQAVKIMRLLWDKPSDQ